MVLINLFQISKQYLMLYVRIAQEQALKRPIEDIAAVR
jgi:hypothetical protein